MTFIQRTQRSLITGLSCIALIASLAGCDQTEIVVSTIEVTPGDTVLIDFPERISAGETVTAAFKTVGGSCQHPNDIKVTVDGNVRLIQPFDEVVTPANSVCTAIARMDPRTVDLTFDAPGDYVVRVEGMVWKEADGLVLTSFDTPLIVD